MNVLIIAEKEEAGIVRTLINMETAGRQEIRCFLEKSCCGAMKRISSNPYLYSILYVGRIITDRSDRSDAEIIQRIYSINPRILICMSTSKQYLQYDYCNIPSVGTLKFPIVPEKFHLMMERMTKIEEIRCGDPSFRVPIYEAEGVTMIPAASIRYARKVRKGLRVETECGNMINQRKMEIFEKSVNKMFIRCHGSYIVNLSHVDKLKGSDLRMDNGEWIPVSRQYHRAVRDCLEAYHIFVTPDKK